VTVRAPGAAPGAAVMTSDRLVALSDAMAAVTPLPLKLTAVAPDRFRPESVAAMVVPAAAVAGLRDVIAGGPTVKLRGGVAPDGVVNVTARWPSAASGAIEIRIETLVDDSETTFPLIPVPLNVTALAPERFWPNIVAATVDPGAPKEGEMDVS